MKPEQLKTLRVLVVGAGVTGVSVMRYLHRHQVSFDVADENPTVSDRVVKFLQTGQYITCVETLARQSSMYYQTIWLIQSLRQPMCWSYRVINWSQ